MQKLCDGSVRLKRADPFHFCRLAPAKRLMRHRLNEGTRPPVILLALHRIRTWLAAWLFWAFVTGFLLARSMESLFGARLGHIPGFGCGSPRSLMALAQFWDTLFGALLLCSALGYLPLRALLRRRLPGRRWTNVMPGAVAGAIGGALVAVPMAQSVMLMDWYRLVHPVVDFGGCQWLALKWPWDVTLSRHGGQFV
jgi:hypothetical protein